MASLIASLMASLMTSDCLPHQVRRVEDLVPFFNSASSEAKASFGDGSVFIERFVNEGRALIACS